MSNRTRPQSGRRATIIDVAEAAGVSPATVSNALNGRRHVDAKTRDAVKKAARHLGYTPNLRAQRLRTGQADTIALLSSMPFAVAAGPSRLGFLMEVAAVAAASAIENGLALVLVPPLEKARPVLDRLGIDGALVLEPTAEDAGVAHLRDRGVPVVTIGRQARTDDAPPYVDLRSAATAQLLLDHLKDQGSRRVVLLIGAQARNSYQETEYAYWAFAQAHGMAPLVRRLDERGGEESGDLETQHLLTEHPDIDAICAPVDAFAVGAVRAAQKLGRRVPEDVAVVTRYDGLRARNCTPPLTAVDLHLEEIASLAVGLMLEQIEGRPPRSCLGPLPRLLARESSLRRPSD